MKILMVIPARSKSRRLPDKNIKFLGNKPLLCWSMNSAVDAGVRLTEKGDDVRIIVSTDSEDYQKLANRWWTEAWTASPTRLPAPFLRPADISEDVDTGLVIKHAWEYARDEMDFEADLCVTLQPTSPFRDPDDIVKCIELRNKWAFQTLLSVKKVTEFARWHFKLGFQQRLTPLLDIDLSKLSGDIAQDQGDPVMANGSIYVTRKDVITEGRVYGDYNGGVLMEEAWKNVDIEEEIDFQWAQFLLEKAQNSPNVFKIMAGMDEWKRRREDA